MSFKYIIIHYGLSESFNLGLEHKPQFVYGIRDRLLKLGYRVDLKPVETINCFMLEMCGYEVFKCNIKNLSFNMSYERDSVCWLALNAVEKAEAKFSRARSYMWLRDFTTNFFKHLEHSEAKYDLTTIGSIASMNTCADCCGILRKVDTNVQDTNQIIYPRKSQFEMNCEDMSRAFSNIMNDDKDIADENGSRRPTETYAYDFDEYVSND